MSIIKQLEDISLSNVDMKHILDGKANIITYDKLANFHNVDQILRPFGACVILYLTKKNYGHWCCLFKVDDEKLEFFDPYGKPPDASLDWNIDNYFRKLYNEDYPHLTSLLYNSDYDITYNHFPFQKKAKDIKTCGRHVCMRLLCRKIPLDKYIKIFKQSNLCPDWIVTAFTAFANGNL